MAAGGKSTPASKSQAVNGPAASEARGAADAPPVHGGPARSPLRAARMFLTWDRIRIGDRLRPLDKAKSAAMAVSIGEVGVLKPVLTRPVGQDDSGPIVELIAGLHRCDAARIAGHTGIDCMIREMTDAEARLAECDENLVHADLTAFERAVFVNARLEAWAAAFPDRATVQEGVVRAKRGRPEKGANLAQFPPGMGFAQETAVEIGLSERSVKQALAVFRGLAPDTRAALSGTWIARNEGALRQLAGVADPKEQAGVLQQLLEGATKSVSDAIALNAGRQPVRAQPTPNDVWLDSMSKAFKKATPAQKDLFLHWLSGQKLPAGYRLLKDGADG